MSGRWPALALAVAVHVAFIAVLVFSLRWQNRRPEAVTVELYAPPPQVAVAKPAPLPPPAPEPIPEPKPVPAPEPIPEPKPEPPPKKVVPAAEPRAEKPDPHAAEIAQKARKDEEERIKREIAAREKAERDKKEREKREREKKEADQREAEKKKREEQQRVAEARERQAREAEALKAQAEREQAARAVQQKLDAEAAARARAEADYVRRIRSKVKGNVILPPDIASAGNPEAIFDVVQLPTGEIIDAVLRKSSGSRAYDDAVHRAIVKSSPLPRPERPELFQRTLTLKFRPQD
jgi:colicin import membrane protein